MTRSRLSWPAAVIGAAALLLSSGPLGQAADAPAGKKAKDDPPPAMMTIQIFNSSSNYNIYPVIEGGGAVGAKGTDDWLQAYFGTTKADINTNTYPRAQTYRIFINPAKDGIPPNTGVTFSLPLLTQVDTTVKVDPTKPDQYVNWWKGGRIYIYDAPVASKAPPAALLAMLSRSSQSALKNFDKKNSPTCIKQTDTPTCPDNPVYTVYVDTGGSFKNNQPSQVTEYTLGAVIPTGAKGDNSPYYSLNTFNVDYDVSYVNNAYLPVAMGVLNNKHVGYIGTIQPIDTFRAGMAKFNKDYPNWPRYVGDDKKALPFPKLASPLEVFQLAPQYVDLAPIAAKNPFNALATNWKTCVKAMKAERSGKNLGKGLKGKVKALPAGYCDAVKSFRALFQANYDNYSKTFAKEKSCDSKKTPQKLTEDLMIQHVYAWTPFNFWCSDAKYNLLANTPPDYNDDNYKKYQKVKALFDTFQRAGNGVFDPWVLLIHDSKYLNSPNAYAYSVDDALGNMQADGDGLVLAVGGKKGLPVPTPAVPPIIVSYGAPTKAGTAFTMFGACDDPPNRKVDPNYFSFIISPEEVDQCVMTLQDNKKPPVVYKFGLKMPGQDQKLLPFPPKPEDAKPIPPENKSPVNCDDATTADTKTWCKNTAYVYSELQEDANGYVHHFIVGSAIDPPKKPK